MQTFGLQALQSKALYGGKTTCKTPFCKPYKAKLCMAAKLRFASHTKLTKLCVQKLCFCKYKLCKALANLRVPKQSFGSQTEGGKTSCKTTFCKPYKAKLCMAAKLLAEGGKTPCKTTFCKPYKAYKAKLCTSFVRRLQALQSFVWLAQEALCCKQRNV